MLVLSLFLLLFYVGHENNNVTTADNTANITVTRRIKKSELIRNLFGYSLHEFYRLLFLVKIVKYELLSILSALINDKLYCELLHCEVYSRPCNPEFVNIFSGYAFLLLTV